MLAFEFTVDTALIFWQRVKERGADTVEEREEILLEMAREGLVTRVTKTNRTKEEYIKDLARHNKVLKVTPGEV